MLLVSRSDAHLSPCEPPSNEKTFFPWNPFVPTEEPKRKPPKAPKRKGKFNRAR